MIQNSYHWVSKVRESMLNGLCTDHQSSRGIRTDVKNSSYCRCPQDLHSWLSKGAPRSSEERAFLKSPSPEAANIIGYILTLFLCHHTSIWRNSWTNIHG